MSLFHESEFVPRERVCSSMCGTVEQSLVKPLVALMNVFVPLPIRG